jgi:chromosome segregation ATPase
MMSDIYEANAPLAFPSSQEQPAFEEDTFPEGVFKTPPIKETVDRWKKEVVDRIQFLKENLEQAGQEKESLGGEVDRLQTELLRSQERARELETQFSEALETFNQLLNEVSRALEG